MTKIKEKITQISNNIQNIYRNEIEVDNHSFMSFIYEIDNILYENNIKYENCFIYFEQNPDIRLRNILFIKLDDNEIVFSVKFKSFKKDESNSIKLEHIIGVQSFNIVKKLTKPVVSFFHDAKKEEIEKNNINSILHLADLKTRKVSIVKETKEKRLIYKKENE